jgi:hypothetical protein
VAKIAHSLTTEQEYKRRNNEMFRRGNNPLCHLLTRTAIDEIENASLEEVEKSFGSGKPVESELQKIDWTMLESLKKVKTTKPF